MIYFMIMDAMEYDFDSCSLVVTKRTIRNCRAIAWFGICDYSNWPDVIKSLDTITNIKMY